MYYYYMLVQIPIPIPSGLPSLSLPSINLPSLDLPLPLKPRQLLFAGLNQVLSLSPQLRGLLPAASQEDPDGVIDFEITQTIVDTAEKACSSAKTPPGHGHERQPLPVAQGPCRKAATARAAREALERPKLMRARSVIVEPVEANTKERSGRVGHGNGNRLVDEDEEWEEISFC